MSRREDASYILSYSSYGMARCVSVTSTRTSTTKVAPLVLLDDAATLVDDVFQLAVKVLYGHVVRGYQAVFAFV